MIQTHVHLYDRVYEFQHRMNPVYSEMGKDQSQILLDCCGFSGQWWRARTLRRCNAMLSTS